MTTQQIGYFLKLAEELNYTKVAQMFFITQPTLSKQIVNLENELKITLFSRDHNSVSLTPAGKRFYERMKPVFQDLMDAIRDAQSYDDNRETFTIGLQEEQLMSNALTLAINVLRDQFPNLNIAIHRANIDELIEGLESQKYDMLNLLGNILSKSATPSALERYHFMPLETEDYCLAYSRSIEGIPEEISKDTLTELLSEHDLIFPVLRNVVDNEQARNFFIESMSGIDVKKIKIHVTQSGRPISLPVQVASNLGMSLCNSSSLFSIDPQIKLAHILETEGAYQKGLLYHKQPSSKYVPILTDLVSEQLKRIRG